jgi:hypothetical protein
MKKRGRLPLRVCAGCNVIENNKMQGTVVGTGAEGGKLQRKDGTIIAGTSGGVCSVAWTTEI